MSNKTKGFASMDKKRHKELSSKGGKKAHERGNVKVFTSETGRLAGKKPRKVKPVIPER